MVGAWRWLIAVSVMPVRTWHVGLYITVLLFWAVVGGWSMHHMRLAIEPMIIDITMVFVMLWLGVSLFAEPFGAMKAIEDKLQLLIDLLVLVCKKLHKMEEPNPEQSPLSSTTVKMGWMRDFKSESSVDLMRQKYT